MAASINEDQVAFLNSSSQGIDMIEGDITSTINRNNRNELSTLDEPVLDTIKRLYFSAKKYFLINIYMYSIFSGDLGAVCRKFGYAIIPRHSSTLLQQWDLWGPLILITTLAILLQSNATKSSAGVQFAEVFTLMLIGSIAVTVCISFNYFKIFLSCVTYVKKNVNMSHIPSDKRIFRN